MYGLAYAKFVDEHNMIRLIKRALLPPYHLRLLCKVRKATRQQKMINLSSCCTRVSRKNDPFRK